MYYPQSQIKANLYTNGDEYILSTTEENYKGHFYEVSNGSKYTGKSPSDPPNILLIPIPSEEVIGIDGNFPLKEIVILNTPYESYTPISSINSQYTPSNSNQNLNSNISRILPSPNPTLPTSQDYKFGKFQRYFAKKNNELRYLEIDKQTYTLLQNEDPTIAWDLYTPITVTWELSGNGEKTYNINKNVVSLAEQNNRWYGFTQWFKDKFLKYYQNLISQENLYTSGKEFETPNGREYIGLYHIHPENGAMVGATHIKEKHDFLTPINSTILSPLTSSQSPSNTFSSPSSGGGGGGY